LLPILKLLAELPGVKPPGPADMPAAPLRHLHCHPKL